MGKAIKGGLAAIVVGVAALATTSLTAVALAWPGSPPAGLVDLAPIHEKRAASLTEAASAAPDDLMLAGQETRLSLRQNPANPTAWLRLAYIESESARGLGPSGIESLARSYAVAPYGPDDTAWRLRFAFNHWSALDRPTRLLVLDELRVATLGGSRAVRGLAQDIYEPSGRLAAELSLAAAERERRRNEAQG